MSENANLSNITEANVRLREIVVGYLKKTSQNQYEFKYNKEFLRSGGVQIATSFPLSEKVYHSTHLHPFFDNLILEGWLLIQTEKRLHIDRNDRWALLMASGRRTIGAITVHPLNEDGREIDLDEAFQNYEEHEEELQTYWTQPLPDFQRCTSCFKLIVSGKIHRPCTLNMWGTVKKLKLKLAADHPESSFSRMIYSGSISGAQRKGLFHLDSSKGVLIPMSREAQYIIKPRGDFPELPENEHVTMAIAKKLKFETPPFALMNVEKIGNIFAIKRFDRSDKGPLMVEDMAQIINVQSKNKYGSSCEKVAKAICQFSSAPSIDLIKYFRRLVFCYFVGNGDMHLKNWSLLENPRALGTYILSPNYDLLNTRLALPKEKIDIGLTIKGKNRHLQRSYFEDFGKRRLNLNRKIIDKIFSEINLWWDVTQDFVKASLLQSKSKERYLEIVNERKEILGS